MIEEKSFEDIINDLTCQGIIWYIRVPLLVVNNIRKFYGYSTTSQDAMKCSYKKSPQGQKTLLLIELPQFQLLLNCGIYQKDLSPTDFYRWNLFLLYIWKKLKSLWPKLGICIRVKEIRHAFTDSQVDYLIIFLLAHLKLTVT